MPLMSVELELAPVAEVRHVVEQNHHGAALLHSNTDALFADLRQIVDVEESGEIV